MSMQSPPPAASKDSIVKGFMAVVHLLPVIVLLQAVIAGNFEDFGYGSWSIVPHGILGNLTFILVVAALVLAIVGKLPKPLVVVAGVLVVLVIAQIGMGYSVRNNNSLGAWHIPLGVLIFGGTVYLMTIANRGVGRPAGG